MRIENTLNALLFRSRAGTIGTGAVRIIQATNANLRQRKAGRGSSRTIRVSVASLRNNAPRIRASGLRGLSASPVAERALIVIGTFDTTSLVNVTEGSTLEWCAVGIAGTEVGADTVSAIAVQLVGNFSSVLTSAGVSSISAIVTASVGSTVRNVSRAISIHLARSTSSIGLTFRLSRNVTTIQTSAIGVGSASLAGLIGLTISLSGVGKTVRVILGVVNASVRIHADSGGTNGVASHGRRTVVGNTIGIVGASDTSTGLHAILVGGAIVIASAGRGTEGRCADGLSALISVPGVSGLAIGIGSAIEANSVGHAVGSLSSSAITVLVASRCALSGSLVAVGLATHFTTIACRASSAGVSHNTIDALAVGLTVGTSTGVSR